MIRLLTLRQLLLPLAFFVATGTSSAAPLSDIQAVKSHLKRAEDNLKLVDGSIGQRTSPPKGSAGKLAKMRLEQARADLEPAGKKLAKISGGSELAEVKKRYDNAVKLYNKLAGILTGTPPQPTPQPKPQPTPTPQPNPSGGTPAGGTVKLGYPHADNFKNALFGLRRVEGEVAALDQLVGQMRPVQDQLTINHRTTAGAISGLNETRRQSGFVRDALGKIPANGEGVAEAKTRLSNVFQSLDSAQAYLQPLNAQLMQLVDPRRYPEFSNDVKRLSELSSGYANPQMLFTQQLAQAAEVYSQAQAAQNECQRIAQAYGRLVQQETEQGKRIDGLVRGFQRNLQGFLAMAQQQRTALPAAIRNHFAEADRNAADAVENKKPLWFTGGIPQTMGFAEEKLALFEVIDPQGAGPLRQEYEALQANLRQRADSLRELIIAQNNLPHDRFAGADRDAAIAIAKDAWDIQEKDFELLAIRIPAEAWSRQTKWTYSNGTWYFSDRSHLQVRLVVADKTNPELAMDRPINVYKDHQKGDTMIGVPMRSFDEELQPSEYFLRSKVQ